MSLTPGTRVGTHEIVAPPGAGGMGEVYRARDTENLRSYDVSADGRRFLMVKESAQVAAATRIDVLLNGLETPARR